MKDLQDIRKELDALDAELVALFERRMMLSREVAAYKISKGLPVLDAGREEQVLISRAAKVTDPYWGKDVRALYECIMALSRGEQEKMIREVHRDA